MPTKTETAQRGYDSMVAGMARAVVTAPNDPGKQTRPGRAPNRTSTGATMSKPDQTKADLLKYFDKASDERKRQKYAGMIDMVGEHAVGDYLRGFWTGLVVIPVLVVLFKLAKMLWAWA